ncbi:hypothetical protein M569_05820 [Genlisea aurea]|uniref:Uncharacterized protein n=1 Tax=Genlisea aurea TaxID=192259 RepID=S8E007_9LAMI|nr:hypothetical protein M569_05820 [Genlisea aurea]
MDAYDMEQPVPGCIHASLFVSSSSDPSGTCKGGIGGVLGGRGKKGRSESPWHAKVGCVAVGLHIATSRHDITQGTKNRFIAICTLGLGPVKDAVAVPRNMRGSGSVGRVRDLNGTEFDCAGVSTPQTITQSPKGCLKKQQSSCGKGQKKTDW